MSENEIKVSGAQLLYQALRSATEKSKVTGKKQLLRTPPVGLTKEETSDLLKALEHGEPAQELKDIAVLKGRKDTWYYDSTIMTHHFASLDSMIQEKDILHTIATVTRSDSKLYPKATEFRKLMDTPFWFTEDELLGAAARFAADPQYADIDVIEASNGQKAFYSKQSLDRKYAEYLHEWYEVGIYENP